MIKPASGMLVTVTNEEIIAAAKRQMRFVGDATLMAGVELFRQVCAENNVVLLQATPDDFKTIGKRIAIGWSDDRP